MLNGRLVDLNRFHSRPTDKCKSFFQAIQKNGAYFCWNEQCEAAFQDLKKYLTSPPLLSKPLTGETIFGYLTVLDSTVSEALVREDGGIQKSMYYVGKSLINAKTRYQRMKNLVLALCHYEEAKTLFLVLPNHRSDRVSPEERRGEFTSYMGYIEMGREKEGMALSTSGERESRSRYWQTSLLSSLQELQHKATF